MKRIKTLSIFTAILVFIAFGGIAARAQTTEFSHQGTLNNSATGTFDLEFRLFDAPNGGTLIGSQQRLNVAVTNGQFNVVLDFGAFPPENRFLEIGVRELGATTFTTLANRDKLLSTPYSTQARNAENAVNAVNAQNAQNAVNAQNAASSTNATNAQNAQTAQNALQLGGTPANQFVLGTDPRLNNPRTPLPGSANYIQNGTNQQPLTNFNISGNGTTGGTLTGNVVNTTTHYTIGSVPILKNPGSFNFYAGPGAGLSSTGTRNSFFGVNAGLRNETGSNNSYFGSLAGFDNETGSNNSFFGSGAGEDNTTASGNSFFGSQAGNSNTTGANNAFFGFEAGKQNEVGSDNSFFGYESGESNSTGNSNSFFGHHSGRENTTGYVNSYFGHQAGASSTTGIQNSFFGHKAGVLTRDGSSNTMMGTWAGEWNTNGNYNSFFGVFAGNENTTGDNNTMIGAFADLDGSNLNNATAIGARALVGQSNSIVLGSINGVNGASNDTKVGIGTTAPFDRLHVNGIIRVETLGAAGATALCRNAGHQISTCSSSLRYKTDVEPFSSGLSLVKRLRPISFTWKDGGVLDLGLGAEEVAKIEPLLVTYNDKGEVEGVKYDRVAVVLLNAVKEQQIQIETQAKELGDQKAVNQKLQKQIDALTKSICKSNPLDEVCKVAK